MTKQIHKCVRMSEQFWKKLVRRNDKLFHRHPWTRNWWKAWYRREYKERKNE